MCLLFSSGLKNVNVQLQTLFLYRLYKWIDWRTWLIYKTTTFVCRLQCWQQEWIRWCLPGGTGGFWGVWRWSESQLRRNQTECRGQHDSQLQSQWQQSQSQEERHNKQLLHGAWQVGQSYFYLLPATSTTYCTSRRTATIKTGLKDNGRDWVTAQLTVASCMTLVQLSCK